MQEFLLAVQLVLLQPEGKKEQVESLPNETVDEFVARMQEEGISLHCTSTAKQPQGLPRIYEKEAAPHELKEIHYILTTLSYSPVHSLYHKQTDLERAGDRVDHLHPLQFLSAIFHNEELKTALSGIKQRKDPWVWKKFVQGLGESLTSEANLNNLRAEQVSDFAARLQFDAAVITPAIGQRDWEGLVKALIVTLPRQGKGNRYDM